MFDGSFDGWANPSEIVCERNFIRPLPIQNQYSKAILIIRIYHLHEFENTFEGGKTKIQKRMFENLNQMNDEMNKSLNCGRIFFHFGHNLPWLLRLFSSYYFIFFSH